MSGNNVLTHVSDWHERNTDGKLWDLGLGYESFDACIIVNNTELHQLGVSDIRHSNNSNSLHDIICN
jgi:hypothetical protein